MIDHEVYKLLVLVARRAVDYRDGDPKPGDLVVETSGFLRPVDPDGIGWLIGHGEAAYADDGTGPARDVWDVLPLNPRAKLQWIGGEQFQRWENASFAKVPAKLVERSGIESSLHER